MTINGFSLVASQIRKIWLGPKSWKKPLFRFIFGLNILPLACNGIFAETLNAKYLDIKDIIDFVDSVVKA
jgi:hypothetical protein